MPKPPALVKDVDASWFSDKLPDVAKWGSTGFTLLVALLTAFGIKEGVLDRILRSEPTAALWVFLLVGLGVVLALIGPALAPDRGVHVSWLALGGLVLGLISWQLYPKLREPGAAGIPDVLAYALLAFGVVVALGAAATDKARVPLPAAALMLGVLVTSLGLYGAAKIAVVSKTAPESARLTATWKTQDGPEQLEVAVDAGKRETRPLVVLAVGTSVTGEEPDRVLGRAVLLGDAVGVIDQDLTFGVPAQDIATVTVGVCERDAVAVEEGDEPDAARLRAAVTEALNEADDLCVEPSDDAFQERVRFDVAEAAEQRVTAVLVPVEGKDQVQATLSVQGVEPSSVVRFRVVRDRGAATTELATVALTAGADAVSATTGPLGVTPGDRVQVSYQTCTGEECTPPQDVATLTYPTA